MIRQMNWRIIVTVLLIAFGIAASLSLLTRGKVNTTVAAPGGVPDYILHDFELVALDANGQEAFSVKAPSLVRDERDQHLEVTTPVFRIPPSTEGGNANWDIVSKTAWIRGDNQEIKLLGQVVADTQSSDGRPVKITTEQLNVYPDKRLAVSPVSATVNQTGLTIVGKAGIEAYMDENRVIFKDMRAHYNGR